MSVPILYMVAKDQRTEEQKKAMYQAVVDMEVEDRAN